MSIEEIKTAVSHNLGKDVILFVNNGRRKNDIIRGKLTAVYPQIFTLSVNTDDLVRTYSYAYSEIKTKRVRFVLS